MDCKWVYKIKTDSEGKSTRFKDRLVCRAFTQIQGEDYDDTFSPVVKMTTLRVVCAIVASLDLEAGQGDADNAYVQSNITKFKIYVRWL